MPNTRPPSSRLVPNTQPQAIPVKDGVVVLSGYGLRIAVDRGHLMVNDGIGDTRRSSRFYRATCGLKRLVVLGHSGTISLEALHWVSDTGAACPPRLLRNQLRRSSRASPGEVNVGSA